MFVFKLRDLAVCVVESTHVLIHMDSGLNPSSVPDQVSDLGQFASPPCALSEVALCEKWGVQFLGFREH